MQKNYDRINWENYPSTQTALNETNLNHMDSALDAIDNIVVDWDVTKAETSELLTALSGWSINNDTGVVTLTYKNGSTQNINTNISKIATNIEYDAQNERLVLTLPDGSKTYVDMSALITQYEFKNTSSIGFMVDNGSVKAYVVDGSVTENKLQPNFLADCRSAESGASTAKLEAEGFAVGQQNGVDVGTDSPYYHNNAKYYSDKAGGSSLTGLTDTDIINPTNKQALVFDSGKGKWVNGDVNLDSKADGISFDASSSELSLLSGTNVLDTTTIEIPSSATEMISDEYDASKAYTQNDYFIHNNILYKVIADCQGITPPNATYYEATQIVKELSKGGSSEYTLLAEFVSNTQSQDAIIDLTPYNEVVVTIQIRGSFKQSFSHVFPVDCLGFGDDELVYFDTSFDRWSSYCRYGINKERIVHNSGWKATQVWVYAR